MKHKHMPEATEVKHQICRLLLWDEMQYATLQYNMGLHYLCLYLSDHTPTIDMMQRSALYWNWWKAKWVKRDIEWLDKYSSLPDFSLYSNGSRVSDYYAMHDARELVHQISPAVAIIQYNKIAQV